jgi:hypothetical protein
MMKNYNVRWKGEYWVVDVALLMPDITLKSLVNYVLKIQEDRYLSMPMGDKKEELGIAIQALKNGKIQQRIVDSNGDTKGDLKLFEATPENRKIFSFT